MLWLYPALLSAVFLAISTLLQKVFVKTKDPMQSAVFFEIIAAFVMLVIGVAHGLNFNGVSGVALNIAIMPFIYAGAIVCFFKALKLAEASEVTILNASRPFWVALGSVLVLREVLTTFTIFGTVLVIASIVIISYDRIKRRKGLKRSHLFALLAAILFGLGFINDAFVLKSVDLTSYLVLDFVFPAIVLLAIAPKSLMLFRGKKDTAVMTLVAAFYVLSAVLIYYSYVIGGQAAQVYPIGQSNIIMTVVLAALFLKETKRLPSKILATVLVFAGVIIIGSG